MLPFVISSSLLLPPWFAFCTVPKPGHLTGGYRWQQPYIPEFCWRGKESGFVWGQTLSFKSCHFASSASLEKAAWFRGVSPMMFLSLLMSKKPSFPRLPSCRVMTATSVSSRDCHFYHAPSLQVSPSCLHSVRLNWGPAHVHQSHSSGPGKIYSDSAGGDGCKIHRAVAFISEVASPIFWLKSLLSKEQWLFTHS